MYWYMGILLGASVIHGIVLTLSKRTPAERSGALLGTGISLVPTIWLWFYSGHLL